MFINTRLITEEEEEEEGINRQFDWLNEFKLSFDSNLVLDRTFMSEIESKVCIADIDEPVDSGNDNDLQYRKTTVEHLQLIYAMKYDNELNFRELPVSLSRLYFTGRNRVQRFIKNMNNWQLDQCLGMLENDGFVSNYRRSESEIDDPWNGTLYKDVCSVIEDYITQVLDLCLCSFETCLDRTIELLSQGKWLSANLFYDLQSDAHWKELPLVFSLNRPITQEDLLNSGYLIWLVCVWRINTTLMITRLLSPWETPETEEWIQYKLKLFRDNHLDIMSEMSKRCKYKDTELYRSKILHEYYPSVHRVLCAEELADLIRYSTDNFRSGSDLKKRDTEDDKFGHLYFNKPSPNICKIRNMFDICIRYGEQHPRIYESLKNTLRCMLLGNLPKSQGTLSMLARIKINLSFHKDEADKEIPEEIFKEMTKDKALKRKKSTGDEQMQYVKTNFKLWLLLNRHFFLYLLKEYLMYTAEVSSCYDEICAMSYKWIRNKEIIRMGNGRCRNILSAQAHPYRPFDWDVIEYEKKSKVKQDIKSGEIKKFHHWALGKSSKIKKAQFLEILAKKMIGTEKCIDQSEMICEKFYQDFVPDGETQTKITIDELHFICWYMARNKATMIETKWFQVMGMTLHGIACLRNWQFCYYIYDIPDNSLNNYIEEFRNHSMVDYNILKTAIRLIGYYKEKHNIVHLCIETTNNQSYAMRKGLNIDDFVATPEYLGVVYQCSGCMKFANSITVALTLEQKIAQLLQVEKNRLMELHSQQLRIAAATAMTTSNYSKHNCGSSSSSSNNNNNALQLKIPKPKNKKNTQQNLSYSFLNKTFYNSDDGLLYCTKYISERNKDLPNAENMTVIIRKKNSPITIASSKKVQVRQSTLINEKNNSKAVSKRNETQSFFCSEKNMRDRAEKKLEWLMQTSSRDALMAGHTKGVDDTNGDDNAGDDDDVDDVVIGNSLKETTSGSSKKLNIKKVIHDRIEATVTAAGYTCQSPLMRIDMIGICKNGKVNCEICGIMTERKNHNMMGDGRITCGRHKEWFHPVLSKNCTITSFQQQQTNGNNAKLGPMKYRLNPIDIVSKTELNVKCRFCSNLPKFRIAVINNLFKIEKISLCKICFDRTRTLSLELNTLTTICNKFT